jgi:hypothetical protein
MHTPTRTAALAAFALTTALGAWAANPVCEAKSGPQRTPVIELYTSEGCSSCPSADQWLSTLKGKPVIAQAFHVGYWDYIGWVDRFATPAHTSRQRDIAAANGLRGIYTPQLVRNGRDWRDYGNLAEANAPAAAVISLARTEGGDNFEARILPTNSTSPWSAYWTVTEHGHSSRVKAGENSGEFLKHDFVVRQYTPVGRYQGAQTLKFVAIPASADHQRQINLVVSDPKTGEPLQGISLQCL